MIGLFGCYRANSAATVDIAPMLASLPQSLRAEAVTVEGGAFAHVAHGPGRSGGVARDGDLTVLVCGEIFNLESFDDLGTIPDSAVALVLHLARQDRLDRLAAANGQFSAVVYDRAARRLRLVTDRLATFPMHIWQGQDELVFATHLHTLIAHPAVPRRADPAGVAQLFTMQRTIGRTTPLADIAAMPAAAILEFDAAGRRERRYWELAWRKRDFSLNEGAELLADALRTAVARQTRGERVGLLLSGGLDSRAVLAAAERGRMSSWTTASYDANPELALARDVAAAFGSEHHALIVEPKDTLAVLDQTVIESSGLYPASTPMSAFLPQVGAACDAILSGHGLDYTLRGYYLPARFAEIAGSRTRLPALRPISARPTAAEVLDNLRQGPPKAVIERIVRKDHRAAWWQGLAANMQDALAPWLESDEPYNAWDGFILHAVSKHYAFTGMMAVRAVGDLRLPAFDNDVFDVYLRMPPAWRCNGRMMQLALRRLSPAAYRMANANTGFRTGLHPWLEVGALMGRAALRRLRLLRRPAAPSAVHSTGSWQNLAVLYREEPAHRAHFKAIRGRLDALSFGVLDPDGLGACIDEHMDGRANHSKLMRQLLTHDSWVRNFSVESGRAAAA
jgi:asparagine synthetase B (glutamine-hydrolysing)